MEKSDESTPNNVLRKFEEAREAEEVNYTCQGCHSLNPLPVGTTCDPGELSDEAMPTESWCREDKSSSCYLTTRKDGPPWSQVYRRVTTDMKTGEFLEDLPVSPETSTTILHRQFEDKKEEGYPHRTALQKAC